MYYIQFIIIMTILFSGTRNGEQSLCYPLFKTLKTFVSGLHILSRAQANCLRCAEFRKNFIRLDLMRLRMVYISIYYYVREIENHATLEENTRDAMRSKSIVNYTLNGDELNRHSVDPETIPFYIRVVHI